MAKLIGHLNGTGDKLGGADDTPRGDTDQGKSKTGRKLKRKKKYPTKKIKGLK